MLYFSLLLLRRGRFARFSRLNLEMKAKIHPEYGETTITCACGNVIRTRSTRKDLHIGICNVCHPFFTGQQKLVDTAGRVERFQRRYTAKKK